MISVAWNVGQYKMSGPQITLPLIPNSIYTYIYRYMHIWIGTTQYFDDIICQKLFTMNIM